MFTRKADPTAEGHTVKRLHLLFVPLLWLVCSTALAQHTGNWPNPPQSADKPMAAQNASPQTAKSHPPSPMLERDAKELLELSESLQPDIQSVNRGILPKDTIAKLKRIEKISKQLRSELGQ